MKTRIIFWFLNIFLMINFLSAFSASAQNWDSDDCNPNVDKSYCHDSSSTSDCGTHYSTYDSSCGSGRKCCSKPPSSPDDDFGGGGITIPDVGLPDPPDTTGKGPLLDVLLFFMKWILTVFVVLAVISFVITGVQYFFALGDKYSAENAKNNFKYSVVAVLVTGISLIIILTIDNILSGNFF